MIQLKERVGSYKERAAWVEKALVALSCSKEAAPVVQRRVRRFWSKKDGPG